MLSLQTYVIYTGYKCKAMCSNIREKTNEMVTYGLLIIENDRLIAHDIDMITLS